MSCFRPRIMTRFPDGEVAYGYLPSGYQFEVPCYQCVGCKMDRARAWSIRCNHEASLYDSNLFVTLTYSPEGLGDSRTLEYGHFQSFMRRLRDRFKGVSVCANGHRSIRFFVSGEYGGLTERPHWHALLFNCWIPDMQKMYNGHYVSKKLEATWGMGNVDVVGEVNAAIAAYVAGYVLTKLPQESYEESVLNMETGELSDRRPPLVQMSRDPGIGRWWYDRYVADCFPRDEAIQDGKAYKVPPYYWRLYKEHGDAGVVEEIEYRRFLKAAENKEDSTPERRAVREEVMKARVEMFKERGL